MSSIPDSNLLDRPDERSLHIEIVIDDSVHADIDSQRLRQAVSAAAAFRGFDRGGIGIRITDDDSIETINRDHLGHDYPTDVISFTYACNRPRLEGELVVSSDTAGRRAAELGWPAEHELVLYVVHGTLHITGMDDQSAPDRARMRQAEAEIMIEMGIEEVARFGADADPASSEGRA